MRNESGTFPDSLNHNPQSLNPKFRDFIPSFPIP
jgi:hypothetical protein